MNSDATVTVSIVLYNNDPSHVLQLVQSLKECTRKLDVYFVDNSPSNDLSGHIPDLPYIHYRHNTENLGYGKANNLIMEEKLDEGDYHLAMNADVYFDPNTLEGIIDFMDSHKDIGLLLPRVLNPDGSEQPLYKLLPRPQDLLLRRFIPNIFKGLFQRSLDKYRMAFADEQETFDAPYLSGCFMFLRKSALKEVGLFDPRFFLYCEDVDLSRRVRTRWRTTYYAGVSIYHYFYKGSYKEPKLLYYHVASAIKYFNKYGWIIDKECDQINKETTGAFTQYGSGILFQESK